MNNISKNRGTAVITGGSSGIGAAYACRLAAEGYKILLVARRSELMEKLKCDLEGACDVNVDFMAADLANPNQLKEVEEKISGIEDLTMLINNAGFGLDNNFLDISPDVNESMLRVHNIAPVRLCQAAIPVMKKAGGGSIINVSSVASFLIGTPAMLYFSTKLFLNSFSESLHVTLRDDNIRAQSLCPGYTESDFHSRMGYEHESFHKKHRSMKAEKVVDISLRSLRRKKNRVICIPGFRNRLNVVVIALMPRAILYRLMYRVNKKRTNIKK